MKALLKLRLVIFFVIISQTITACSGAAHSETLQEPPLPAGLRFEVNYRPWYLEGVPHEPVEYLFKIHLRGDPGALKRIRSVQYRLPADESKGARILQQIDYFLEGSMPTKKEEVSIIAVIRWKNGERSSHTIPLRPN